MAFGSDAAGETRVEAFPAEDVVIGDEGLGVGSDEMDEFLGDELAHIAADDVVEDGLGHGRRIFLIDMVELGNAFVTARRGVDVVFVVLVQVFREGGNEFHDLFFDACRGRPVEPLQVVGFHIEPDEAVLLGRVHFDDFVVVRVGRVHGGDDLDRWREAVAVDFPVEDEVHQFLLDRMVAAVDFVDEQENRPALGDFFVDLA